MSAGKRTVFDQGHDKKIAAHHLVEHVELYMPRLTDVSNVPLLGARSDVTTEEWGSSRCDPRQNRANECDPVHQR